MRFSRGLTLLEVVLALGLTLTASVALTRGLAGGLRATETAAERARAQSTIVEAAERLEAEAHRAAAIFTPARDVLGNRACDGAGNCTEVDFFTRDAANAPKFRAYRFDASAHTLQAYDYDDRDANGAKNVRVLGTATQRIDSFAARRTKISQLAVPMLGTYPPRDVEIPLGYPEVSGGNAVTIVSVGNAALHLKHDLLTRFAPSGFGVIVGTFTPVPSSSASPQAPPPANARGISRAYIARTMWRIGPCVNVPSRTPGCGANGDLSGELIEQNGADTGPGGTLAAPLDSRIATGGACGSAVTLAGAHDAIGNHYARATADSISEYWSISSDGEFVSPQGRLAPDKSGDSNPLQPLIRNGPGYSYLTTFELAC